MKKLVTIDLSYFGNSYYNTIDIQNMRYIVSKIVNYRLVVSHKFLFDLIKDTQYDEIYNLDFYNDIGVSIQQPLWDGNWASKYLDLYPNCRYVYCPPNYKLCVEDGYGILAGSKKYEILNGDVPYNQYDDVVIALNSKYTKKAVICEFLDYLNDLDVDRFEHGDYKIECDDLVEILHNVSKFRCADLIQSNEKFRLGNTRVFKLSDNGICKDITKDIERIYEY